MWADPSIKEFDGRVARIQKARQKGYGFEAAGTLGRSHYYKPKSRSIPIVKPIIVIALLSIGLKGMILRTIGADVYQSRVEVMMQSEGFDRLGGFLMTVDPASAAVSEFLTKVFPAKI